MVTLDQIASAMGTDQQTLRSFEEKRRRKPVAEGMSTARREFIHRAFTEGHTPEAIGEYLDRSQIMVEHALRMIAVNELHAEYGQTLAGLRLRLTGDAA